MLYPTRSPIMYASQLFALNIDIKVNKGRNKTLFFRVYKILLQLVCALTQDSTAHAVPYDYFYH